MGFFRRLFGRSKPNKKTKKTDTFMSASHQEWNLDANKHARAVAAATAAVAEAALAAAHAAVEVVRLTNGVGGSARSNVSLPISIRRHRQLAAVKIQSAFRRYLAKRALRALKALVKLQALVRGHIVRKQSADMLRRMQTLVRLQDRARATRSLMSESVHFSSKSSLSYNPLPESPDKIGYQKRVYSSKFDARSSLKKSDSNSKVRNTSSLDRRRLASSGWLDRWMEESLWNDSCDASSLRYMQAENEKVDKILEVDTWKPHLGSQRNTKPFQTAQHVMPLDNNSPILVTFDSPSKRAAKEQSFIPSQSSMDYYSSSSLKYPTGKDELATSMTSENSPQAFSAPSRPGSASARRAHFSPTRSEYSWGFFSSYAGYPSYMANTESFSAKVRSQSVPRQRPEFEKYSMSTKKSIQEFCEAGAFSELGLAQDDDFRSRTYLSSSHSNRIR